MKYIVNNLKNLNNKEKERNVKKLIQNQTRRLKRIADQYSKPLVLNIYFNNVDKINSQISAVIALKENVLYLSEKDKDIEACIFKLFDKLKVSLTKNIHKEKKDKLLKRKKVKIKSYLENLQNLQELRHDNIKETFTELTKILFSDIARYIKRRIEAAEMTTTLEKGKFKIHELLDELYLAFYYHFDDISINKNKIDIWLYKKADDLLNEKLKEFEFDRKKTIRLENILKKERNAFDEQITADADDEIILLDDLDDIVPASDELSVYDLIFEENEDSVLDDITLKLEREEIHKIIRLELAKLPVLEGNILDLYLINQLTEKEIAEIKNISIKEVESIIENSGKIIKEKLLSL
ncbi:RNA polymerase sigma factor [Mariniphaga sp.]|uniref:RNA polymerase sigma factor n=1 Tax=Mariniphaga sp. TaxID=1954475 RepID=UPI0035619921